MRSGLFYTDPGQLDVDHLVPLENAHRSGGWAWTKGAPATWKPPDRAAWCDYAKGWHRNQGRWGLCVVAEEQAALVEIQAECS